jgi:hypothetical protein
VTEFKSDLGGAEMLLGINFFLSHRVFVSKRRATMLAICVAPKK